MGADAAPAVYALQVAHIHHQTYATTMLMVSTTPAFCAKQLEHSAEMILRTYAKWIDGGQNAPEINRLEAALAPD